MKLVKPLLASLVFTAAASAAPFVLYTGTLPGLPESQGRLAYNGAGVLVAPMPPTTVFDSTLVANLSQGGWSNWNTVPGYVDPSFPTLNRATGFQVGATFMMIYEGHLDSARAGWSLIALGADLKGIELAFQGTTVFAQNDATDVGGYFSRGETAALAPLNTLGNYNVVIQGDNYELWDGASQILSGHLRDYTGWVPGPGQLDPYETPNFIFVGDDTTSAQATVALYQLQVDTSPVPEPATAALLLLLGLPALLGRRRRA